MVLEPLPANLARLVEQALFSADLGHRDKNDGEGISLPGSIIASEMWVAEKIFGKIHRHFTNSFGRIGLMVTSPIFFKKTK